LTQEIKFTPTPPPETDPLDPEDKPSFWQLVFQVADDMWAGDGEKGYRVYLYEGPRGRRGQYLEVITHPFDIEWVKQKYGGGEYEASLHDPGWKIVSSARFTIDGPSRRRPAEGQPAQPAAAPASDNFQAQVLQILREGQERSERLLAQVLERDRNPAPAPSAIDPNIALKGVVELFSGVVARAAAPPAQQLSLLDMVALIEKFRGPDLLTVLTQAKAAGLIPASAGGGDLMTQITQLKEAADVLGLSGGKGKNIGEVVVEKLPEILEAGGKAMDKYHAIEQTRLQTARTVREIQQRGGGAPVVMQPQGAPQAPAIAQTSAPQMQTSGVGLEVESPGSQPQGPGQMAAELTEAQINAVKQQVVVAISRGMSGMDIFGYLNTTAPQFLNGFLVHDQAGAITGVVTEQQLAMYCSNDPVLRQATGLPRFKLCLRELLGEIAAEIGLEDEDQEGPEGKVQ
jgi:hypothetical protein